jgi:hypothetical protein
VKAVARFRGADGVEALGVIAPGLTLNSSWEQVKRGRDALRWVPRSSAGETAVFYAKRHSRPPGRRRPIKAKPEDNGDALARHHRVRHDRIDSSGAVTLRYRSRLYHVGLGRVHKGQRVLLLVADRDIRVLTVEGELLRQLTLDPSRDYQPLR